MVPQRWTDGKVWAWFESVLAQRIHLAQLRQSLCSSGAHGDRYKADHELWRLQIKAASIWTPFQPYHARKLNPHAGLFGRSDSRQPRLEQKVFPRIYLNLRQQLTGHSDFARLLLILDPYQFGYGAKRWGVSPAVKAVLYLVHWGRRLHDLPRLHRKRPKTLQGAQSKHDWRAGLDRLLILRQDGHANEERARFQITFTVLRWRATLASRLRPTYPLTREP